MGWFYFKTNLIALQRQLENSYYCSAFRLKFHRQSSVNSQKDGLLVQEAACCCSHQFLGSSDNSTLVNHLFTRTLFIYLGDSTTTARVESGTAPAHITDILHTSTRKCARKYRCYNLIGQY